MNSAPHLAQVLSSHGIGASEIASACGISRYRSRFGLWLEKTGRRPAFSGNVHTRLGMLLEPRARQLYADATSYDVEIPPASIFHPTVTWARCTPDGLILPRTARHGMQIKCVGYFIGRRFRYELPLEYEAQCQWEMFVCDLDRVDLAVLVGSDELEWERFVLGDLTDPAELFARATLDIHPIYRSDTAIASLRAGGEEFMRLVESDTQPPVDGSDDATHYYNDRARKLRPTVEIDSIAVGEPVDNLRSAFVGAKASADALDLAKNQIRAAMDAAGANRIRTDDGPIDLRIDKRGVVSLHLPRAWSATPEE